MSKFAFFHQSGALTCDFFLYCFSSKRKNSKRYGFTILDNFQFVEQIRNKQQQLGEPHDFTHKQQ